MGVVSTDPFANLGVNTNTSSLFATPGVTQFANSNPYPAQSVAPTGVTQFTNANPYPTQSVAPTAPAVNPNLNVNPFTAPSVMLPASYDQSAVDRGYNPYQYASDASASSTANMLGGSVVKTAADQGLFKVPQQNMIDLGGQDAMNAGLLAQRYSTMGKAQADAITQAELATMGPRVNSPSDSITYENRAATSPAAPLATAAFGGGNNPNNGTTQPAAAPAPGSNPYAPTSTSQGTATAQQGAPGSGSNQFNWSQMSGASSNLPPQLQQMFQQQAQSQFGTGGSGGSPYGQQYGASQYGQAGGSYGTGSSVQQYMANLANGMQPLQGIAANAGYATDATPAWQAMLTAQQRQIDRGAADLSEKFNVSGNRFSSAFGGAAGDYYNQAAKDQNSLIGQMTYQSQEAARARELQAAGQLGQFAFQGPSQLASQEYGSQQQMQQAALQAALYGANGADQAAGQLASMGGQGANALLGTAMQGAGALYNTENNAANNIFQGGNQAAGTMYAGQMAGLQNMTAYDQALRSLGLQGAQGLSQQWNQSLQLGSQLGNQQLGIDATNLDRIYQEWLRTQPEYNPLLQYISSAATNQPVTYMPQYKPSMFSQLAAGIGQIGAGLSGFMPH